MTTELLSELNEDVTGDFLEEVSASVSQVIHSSVTSFAVGL